MNDLLKTVLSLSLSGTLLILLLCLLRPLFKERLSKRWQYYIWLVVIARLLLPFAPETNLMGTLFQEIGNGIGQMETVLQPSQNTPLMPEMDLSGGMENGKVHFENERPAAATTTAAATQSLPGIIMQNLWMGWIVAALILLIRKITMYQSFVKYVRAGCVEASDIDLLERFGKLVGQSGVKNAVELYTNGLISSPLLIGFFRPCIVLPSANMSASDFRYTVLHELTHYQRRDMFYKWLMQVAICVHWFNPLIYFMGKEVDRACELSCDEAVIKPLNTAQRRAYGDTLLNAMGAGGSYQDSIASVPLNESGALLKERLDAIMGFQKKTRMTAAFSMALVFILCFGAAAAGAYTNSPPADEKERPAYQTAQPDAPVPASAIDGNLTLVKKEYSAAEIASLNISGVVVEALSENVSITKGGETLKVAYYIRSQDDYTLQNESDGGGTFEELVLRRVTSESAGDTERPVFITIPENSDFKVIGAITGGGDINFENCSGKNVFAETQSGDITVMGGTASSMFKVETESGNALVSNFQAGKYGTDLNTESGTITFQPKDSVKNCRFILDTGANAQITINGKKYSGGDYEINPKAAEEIYFDSVNGSLVVQDLSRGKLPVVSLTAQILPAAFTQPGTAHVGRLTRIKKEYAESDLRALGIAGVQVEAQTENIVVRQGGDSLIVAGDESADYMFETGQYELYNEEYMTPEEFAAHRNASGKITELKVRRVNEAEYEPARTLYLTLPEDLQYSRAVRIVTDSGNIQFYQCDSPDILDAVTQSGSILAENCRSPLLGVTSGSGQIDISSCSINFLNAEALSGTLTLQLPNRTSDYQIAIDTGAEALISINGTVYQAGETLLNANASGRICFSSHDGSLVITEKAAE